MNLYQAECEVNGLKIVYKTVIAADEREAMDKVMNCLKEEEVTCIDVEPPCILNLECVKENV